MQRSPTSIFPAPHRQADTCLHTLGQREIAQADLLAAGDIVRWQTLRLLGPLIAQLRTSAQQALSPYCFSQQGAARVGCTSSSRKIGTCPAAMISAMKA
jgi:hypothetical protein